MGVGETGVGEQGISHIAHDPLTQCIVSPVAVTAILLGLMGYRFYNSGKFMPAGLVTALR